MALAEYMAYDTGDTRVNNYTPLIKDKSVEFLKETIF